jgi:hypothetical protein
MPGSYRQAKSNTYGGAERGFFLVEAVVRGPGAEERCRLPIHTVPE